MRNAMLALVLWAAPWLTGHATELADLMDTLRVQPGVSRAFTEQRYNPLLEHPVLVRGHVRMDHDGRLWKHIESPFVESVSLDADRATLERDGVVRELDLARGGATGSYLQSLYALLQGDAERLKSRFEVEIRELDADGWQLILVPRERRLRRHLARLLVEGEGADVERIRTVQGEDSWQEMRFDAAPAQESSRDVP